MGKFLARCSVLFDSVVNLNFIFLAKHSAKKNHSRNLHCSRNLMDARFRRCYARVSVSFGLGTAIRVVMGLVALIALGDELDCG